MGRRSTPSWIPDLRTKGNPKTHWSLRDPYVPNYPKFKFDPENWFKKRMSTLTKPKIELHCGHYPSGVLFWYAIVRIPVEGNPHVEVIRWKSPNYFDLSILWDRVKGYMRKGR